MYRNIIMVSERCSPYQVKYAKSRGDKHPLKSNLLINISLQDPSKTPRTPPCHVRIILRTRTLRLGIAAYPEVCWSFYALGWEDLTLFKRWMRDLRKVKGRRRCHEYKDGRPFINHISISPHWIMPDERKPHFELFLPTHFESKVRNYKNRNAVIGFSMGRIPNFVLKRGNLVLLDLPKIFVFRAGPRIFRIGKTKTTWKLLRLWRRRTLLNHLSPYRRATFLGEWR